MRCISILHVLLPLSAYAARYSADQVQYNLNTNKSATEVLDYYGKWEGHTFYPSPDNWRFPIYTIILDKWVDGDPRNNDADGTVYEYDPYETQFRHGGDATGLKNSLDYLQGMGIKVGIVTSGTFYLQQPWQADQYSPLDFTLLDPHLGGIDEWRALIDEIHSRGMYFITDMTVATLGDLVGFQGYLNTSTPFSLNEHKAQWKTLKEYPDFHFNNEYNESCTYPDFWGDDGERVYDSEISGRKGCYESDFDQYGDTEAFGVYPDWQRQLSKFASVQDRLRDWKPTVAAKLQHLACLAILMLDVDGFRIDKATQMTVDFMADWASSVRDCAKSVGKENIYIPGEITGGDYFGAIYLGRGREPSQRPAGNDSLLTAMTMTGNSSQDQYFLRKKGHNGLDSTAFSYTTYRALTRFLHMDGNLQVAYDLPVDFAESWNLMSVNDDFVNPNTDVIDPKHMFGLTNHDVFRWAALADGQPRQILGSMITTIMFPGISLVYYGEEQALYLFDSTADNYLFGRQPIVSSIAWQTHGCYAMGSSQYFNMPVEPARNGCYDDWNSLDHRDPAAESRVILKQMYELRSAYPSLNDGFNFYKIRNWTVDLQLPGSNGVPTTTGLWSVVRGPFDGVQNFYNNAGNTKVWVLYTNLDSSKQYEFICNSADAIVSPFISGTTVKNLFWPHDEYTLADSTVSFYKNSSKPYSGCLDKIFMDPWSFKAFVPKVNFVPRHPTVTGFLPGHDARLNNSNTVDIEIKFSQEMDCKGISSVLHLAYRIMDTSRTPTFGIASCETYTNATQPKLFAAPGSSFVWRNTISDVADGIYSLTLRNASNLAGTDWTYANDTFLLRIGNIDNPLVHTRIANYSKDLLSRNSDGKLQIKKNAAGADLFRYSLDFFSSWTNWLEYPNGTDPIALNETHWTGTSAQAWEGTHVVVQYYSFLSGSSSHIQHADLDLPEMYPYRRFPHLWLNGPFNKFGYDQGLNNKFHYGADGKWRYDFMADWDSGPTFQMNVWNINPDARPDVAFVYGDTDLDGIIDRLPPSALASNLMTITHGPESPYLSWQIVLDDATRRWTKVGKGSRTLSLIFFIGLFIIPVFTGALAAWTFMGSFYAVKFNKHGKPIRRNFIPLEPLKGLFGMKGSSGEKIKKYDSVSPSTPGMIASSYIPTSAAGGVLDPNRRRRSVLIATLEYDITDWAIKIKIGGLGVMAQLMSKNLPHEDLIWVVPKVGNVEYPQADPLPPMEVKILDHVYQIDVQCHQLNNIKYVILDAPVFRRQTSSDPYPARMDDLESAIFYSAWNQCIAETIRRYPIDIYHINDYHGALAPLYLLPNVVPCALSLHNAEFQGLWPLRTAAEKEEVCSVFNISESVCRRYVQFGNVFNLLHAGASFLRIHQQGFGSVGVSTKYGKRSWARYPIFWGLSKIGNLPNPDPSDTGKPDDESTVASNKKNDAIDMEAEAKRTEFKAQAQDWAGLDVNPEADLLVFVGRWSMQKGIDLIADIAPSILEEYNCQLITVGPVIDLYGRFAAEKFDKLMKKYPGKVFSKPEFTQLPPYIFSGADFALIPSRDEPFGLVAVEFGRKGALGIGARVGGLGAMPGWWFTVESSATQHMIAQFEAACHEALTSPKEIRMTLRARSAKQRFPVAEWVRKMDELQSECIRLLEKNKNKKSIFGSSVSTTDLTKTDSPQPSILQTAPLSSSEREELMIMNSSSTPNILITPDKHRLAEAESLPEALLPNQPLANKKGSTSLQRMGSHLGPGHVSNKRNRGHRKTETNLNAIGEIDGDESATEFDEPQIPWAPHRTSQAMIYGNDERPLSESQDPNNSYYQVESSRSSIISFYEDDSPPRDSPFGRLQNQNNPYGLQFNSGLGLDSPAQSHQSISSTPNATDQSKFQTRPLLLAGLGNHANQSALSLATVMSEKSDFALSHTVENFTDANGKVLEQFALALENINSKNSKGELCIEEYLIKSEKAFFNDVRAKKLGFGGDKKITVHKAPSIYSIDGPDSSQSPSGSHRASFSIEEPILPLKPPRGLQLFMQRRLGDWPYYSLLMAVGQIFAASSYQLTLLSGSVATPAAMVYAICIIYAMASIIWWLLYRRLPAYYCLSIPFIVYSVAFFLIGLPFFSIFNSTRSVMNHVAMCIYAFASASGSLFFALNFGDEGGAPVKEWVFRACMVQGTQQIWAAALWYWGFKYDIDSSRGTLSKNTTLATLSLAMFIGLPEYYRQLPGKIPSFYRAIARRKLVIWFLIAVVLQNYWLSGPYGLNWSFLWESSLKVWQTVVLIAVFFGGVWGFMMFILGRFSKTHSWFIPIFAIGLGAPRWCQILWATSGLGQWVPWAGTAGPFVSRSLWLWLGILDAVQGIGFGMMLLQTLTRVHVAFSLVFAQFVGSITAVLARITSPSAIGPGDVFPNFTNWQFGDGSGPWGKAYFWMGLACQLIICVGFLLFFRKEQLSKP
ncbi:Cell wall alpha-1,3-glucan synthase ags1 [Neolecta irregularis DAH-3]|uniref:alpha-1,3-glucan synthase n=1 Tax=Neolecta irregularis (strain DAH-3) TaxID=1198029 RepID=A0A1U7LH10_NEOID|nr:Cell wall alpha-1,3-glucan synthase ags1 [Neolecta irregularis DAH-3]|eukprot:OLL21883.1 Cell wall alpha-1,3-glucan synthase ags1 [Neolecta irregularis DAH-3]